MRNKFSLMVLVFVVVLLTAGMNGGCGERYWDEVIYSNPNWTPEGLVYATKTVHHHKEYGGLGGTYNEFLGTDYYYVTMDTDGNNEAVLPYSSYPYFSPRGTYVALISRETISVIRRSDNQVVHTFSPTIEIIAELDWGPGEDKLGYVTIGGALYLQNIDGSNLIKITDSGGSNVAWRNGGKIAFGFLYVVDEDGSNKKYLVDGGRPQIMNDGRIIYYADFISAGAYKIKTIYLSGTGESTIIDSYNKNTLKLSYDNTKIVGAGTGGSGIYISNIDGIGIKQLK